MMVAYVAHPVSGDVTGNLARAKRWLAFLTAQHADRAFIAPWIQSIEAGENDADPEQRERGIMRMEAVAGRCDEIWIVGAQLSVGMQREVNALLAARKSASGAVVVATWLGWVEPPAQLAAGSSAPVPVSSAVAAPRSVGSTLSRALADEVKVMAPEIVGTAAKPATPPAKDLPPVPKGFKRCKKCEQPKSLIDGFHQKWQICKECFAAERSKAAQKREDEKRARGPEVEPKVSASRKELTRCLVKAHDVVCGARVWRGEERTHLRDVHGVREIEAHVVAKLFEQPEPLSSMAEEMEDRE